MNAINTSGKDDIGLPSLPAIVIQILETLKNDDSNYDELFEIIMSDSSLTAKALKTDNFSRYSLSQRVGSLKKALTVNDLNAAKNIAHIFIIAKEQQTSFEEGFDFDLFLKRSVTAAVASDLCGALICKQNDDDFVRGLLQDIGIIIIYLSRKEDYLKIFDEKCVSESSIEIEEKKLFGFDHQDVSSEFLKKWGLSESIYMPISYHHKRDDLPSEYALSIDILYIANKISSFYHGSNYSDNIVEVETLLANKYKKNKEDIYGLIDSVAKQSTEIFSLFGIDMYNIKPYSQILKEANEEIIKLNLSNEQLLIKYKEAKDRAEILTKKLKATNEKLKTASIIDGLTGLYNHMFFQKQLDIELSRNVRYKKPISLMMLDLDYFKNVNDTYGHRIGDIVLQTISIFMQNQLRISDFAFRYGGDEFAIILPETELDEATALAERIRSSIEQNTIRANSSTIKVTISIGIATYLSGNKIPSKSELLDAADSVDIPLKSATSSGTNRPPIPLHSGHPFRS
ncbi:MAG: diguanylate cyclase [Pseudomonadota bacterium]